MQKIFDSVLRHFGLEKINSGTYFGEWAPAKGRELIESKSPINGATIAKITLATREDYDAAVDAAKNSFETWKNIPAPKRGEIIRAMGEELRREKEWLGKLVSIEVGKTTSEGQGEIQEMVDIADFAVGLSRQIYGLTIASERKEHRLYEQWLPLGAIGIISAFNFPSAVWSWNSFIAAVVGDTSVWKPSSKAPLTAIAVMRVVNRVLEREKLPPIFTLVLGRGKETGDWMSEDRMIPLVSFTGSVPTGKALAQKVAARLGRPLLELGGNNAAIVSDKADLGNALKGVAFGALATAGQRCTSTRRLILHEQVYAQFLEKISKAYSKVKVGNPLEAGTLVGPLIDEKAVNDYEKAIDSAVKEGGKLVVGGKRAAIKGFANGSYVEPAIIEAKPGMKIASEETFAPILYVFKYSTIEEAIAIHNSVPQGLSSAIFTKDLREAELFLSARGSDCGLANVNTGTAGAEIGGAFGGEKDTGGGRESGSDSWKQYARRQTATINYGKDLPLSQGVEFEV